ncbi:sensor histidine kinase [Tropicibacter naphthalenivorans]|uniref:histidine kinase n=1 Tax=Tropicibacter naphthalenivorans TaxID=441103 RepID=A0A0P1H1D5_9RHOB|nr:ATP-binding protein [Tropicibacter naphthalenivorans]CUH80567.1 Swarming motility regulation sensor protein RssA [Tropicibacter naphthalenivorans]SMC88052.1 Signal transduction histidine kinase [Tropicibacter naphthalenivorans]
MRMPRSLQARLALSVGVVLTALWLVAATVTAVILRGEMVEVFDSALRETAERILPLAVSDIIAREDPGLTQRLGALHRFRVILRDRSIRDLSPVPTGDLPSELAPLAQTLNTLFGRLHQAFDAERSFAANAAHELRTPLAGAIAQAQRLQAETLDATARARAAEMESTLKRLTRLSERLMQLARAEGSPLRLGHASDLRAVAQLIVHDLTRAAPDRVTLSLPDAPVMSDLDPDAFGILCRNLLENALRHGAADSPVAVTLSPQGRFSVANDGPALEAGTLARLTTRFERGATKASGSGLGLAIVAAIASRIGTEVTLTSPRPGQTSGFEASLMLPVTA